MTAKLADKLAQAVDGALYAIQPAEAYTAADLDWRNSQSRSSLEMNDKTFRPAITGRVENMAQYDTVYVGFPIWWYTAPTIVNTFLEQYDLRGKKIVPFATSGGSGMEHVTADLKSSCPGADLREGRRFDAKADVQTLKAWADAL